MELSSIISKGPVNVVLYVHNKKNRIRINHQFDYFSLKIFKNN